ncbi:MAG: hypothetical protein IT204_19760 [Fimbriimonadaceae bacterium]|nr:hypothetical protein [Fimbriimonadaceae bacterium]
MPHSSRWLRRPALLLAAAGVLLAAPGRALEPVFSNDDSGATRDVKVCMLLLQATSWENPEPFFLPVLAGDTFQRVKNLRPSNWNLVNPLAPPVVTPALARLWDAGSGASGLVQVTFDGISANLDNDFLDNGNDLPAEVNLNVGAYNSAGNPGGPNSYLAHCNPLTLAQIGSGPVVAGLGGISGVPRLPAAGQPVPKTHPAYWEVPLTPLTVSQLANFDAVFVNTHRNLRFTPEDQVLLRQFLDAGGTLLLDDSHGCRMAVRAGGDETLPQDVDFFLPFQFVDGFPFAIGGGNGGTRPDGYPVNRGGVSTLTPSKTVVNANHALLNILHQIPANEADRIGDVRAKDHLILRSASTVYRVEEVLRTTNTDSQWGSPSGVGEPAIAVAQIGSGKLVLSGVDAVDDCAKPFELNQEPTADWLPDIKFMFNLMAWKTAAGGDRRGGANNPGVGATAPPVTLQPKFVWHESTNWAGPSAQAFNTIDAQSANAAALQSDPNYLLKEPLCAKNGIVYLQYQAGGNYWLAAVDSEPDQDLDGDGLADDGDAGTPYGVREIDRFGATSDTLWRRDLGSEPVLGGTVVSIQHASKNVPCDVLFVTQAEAPGTIRVSAFHATVDYAQNHAGAVTDVPGGYFYNWTAAAGAALWTPVAGGDGFVQLDCGGVFQSSQLSAPVAYDDRLYITGSFGYNLQWFNASGTQVTPGGEWARVFALRMVPDPGNSRPAGQLVWEFPGRTLRGESLDPTVISGPLTIDTADPRDYLRANALKLCDLMQSWPFGFSGSSMPNFLSAGAAGGHTLQSDPAGSTVLPTLRDSTNLTPAVGLTTDERTGLTVPTVYLNRTNGDVWAVSADPEGLGWRIAGDIATGNERLPAATVTPTAVIQTTPSRTLVVGTEITFAEEVDANGTVLAEQVLIDPAIFRDVVPYTPVQMVYQLRVGGNLRLVRESRLIYPRQRLLRGDRHSGYESSALGVVDLQGYSNGAPMILDPDTVVATSTALWRGLSQPAADYEGGVPAAGAVGSPYEVRASGTVTFFRAGSDSQDPTEPNSNDFQGVRWVFDPAVVLPGSLNALNSLPPNPVARTVASFCGAPVKLGTAVVAAAAVHGATTRDRAYGAVFAVDPNPLLTTPLTLSAGSLNSQRRSYLLTRDPAAFAAPNNSLAAVSGLTTANLRAYVVDGRQYSVDHAAGQLQLDGPEAHLTRLAQPVSDAAAAQPYPEALRLPLYGRRLWLVQDNDGDGAYLAANDPVAEVYVPAPLKWMALYGTVLLDARRWIVPASVAVTLRGSTTALALGTDYTLDADRPLLFLRAWPDAEYVDVTVTYNTVDGISHSENHRFHRPAPAFGFSPVVAGATVFLAGTELGTQRALAIPLDLRDADASVDWRHQLYGGTRNASPMNGGVYAFSYGADDHVVNMQYLRPDSVPGWTNFNAGVAASFVRGIPLVLDGAAFIACGVQGDGTGSGADNNSLIAPLFALGASELLVTEGQRVAKMDYEGRVITQYTGTKEKIGALRQADLITNSPQPTDLTTVGLSRPSKAYNLPGERVLLVDTGNNRVVETDKAGLVLWPWDSRTGYPDGVLRYLGLRDLGLNRPQDAARLRFNQVVHPLSLYDVDGDGAVGDPQDVVTKDATIIADTGHKRIVMAVTYPAGPRFYDNGNVQSGTYTYYEPLSRTQTGFGAPWELTAPSVFSPVSGQWLQLPYAQLQVWDPTSTDFDGLYDAANDPRDWYLVVRAEGTDQLLLIDPDPDNDGDFDDDNNGVIDGVQTNLANLADNWSGGQTFRGLRFFRRFRVGETPCLAVIAAAAGSSGESEVQISQRTAGGLTALWTFGRNDYRDMVYDNAANDSYYQRRGIAYATRYQQWYANGRKAWNPVAVSKLPNQNLLAIVNGAPNSVNQTGSASEILIVRFDPNDPTNRRVEYVLPDLSTTSTYPAGQAATRRRPETGSYPASSPVFVHQ